MKASLILLIGFLFLLSCEREEGRYDKLTPAQRAIIDARGTQQCLSENTPIYNRWKSTSAAMYSDDEWERGRVYTSTLKKGTTDEKIVEVQVWKQTATEIYFYVKDSRAATNYFLRLQKTVNDQMIQDLLEAHCARGSSKIYTTVTSRTNGPSTFTYEYEISGDPTDDAYRDVYSMNFSYPAYFAGFQINRTLRKLDDNDDQVGSSETFTSTIAASTVDFEFDDHTQYVQRFCVIGVNATTSEYTFTNRRNQEGFFVNLENATECLSTYAAATAAGWNLTF